ncbi:uncharacterized protein C8A04DRAFT_28016 [Dichotomopilus funicola]|uniref:Uncharacterized protein n=1 Tax=Dichotomopilus funicola TaxID=1934379 RepID=A0AAN6V3T1_9PEZI|nr:hypothetical protein C8A04DRAFT_28016 [Dichotomopilus funicola]
MRKILVKLRRFTRPGKPAKSDDNQSTPAQCPKAGTPADTSASATQGDVGRAQQRLETQQQPDGRLDSQAEAAVVESTAADGTGRGEPHKAVVSCLETLPAELRRQILFAISDISGLDDMSAITCASPVFWQQYQLDRKALLEHALHTTLGIVLVDAYAVQTTALVCYTKDTARKSAVYQAIDEYKISRSGAPGLILGESSEQDLLSMANFFRSIVRPLALRYATDTLHKFDTFSEVEISLSKMEQTRILRALYRFQLYCNLFRDWPSSRQDPELEIESTEKLALLFGLFRPWEMEEIDSIYATMFRKYEEVFDAIAWDLHRDNPKFDFWGYPNTPPGARHLEEDGFFREYIRQGTAERGLSLFYNVLCINDHDDLVETMDDNMDVSGSYEDLIHTTTQFNRRVEYPQEGDLAEEDRERLPFAGDREDAPPLAWVIMWKGRYSNWYGDYIPQVFKLGGYVFWDRERLVKEAIKGPFLRAREEHQRDFIII